MKHKYAYMYNLLFFYIVKKKRKQTQALAWVKSSKVMPQLPCYLSFLLGKGGKLLKKLLKYCKVHFLTKKPLQHTSLDLQCVCDTPPKLSIFAKLHVYSLQILHLSSNRREQNSASSFQFMTPGRECTQNP